MRWTPEVWTAIGTIAIAAFTVVLAVSGGIQAWLTRQAIKLARDEFTATHRPRIKVRHVSGPVRGRDGSDFFRVVVANAGESPAVLTNYKIEAFDHDGEAAVEIRLRSPAPLGVIELASGQGYVFETQLEREWAEDPDDPSRDGPVFVVGIVTYADKAGISRHTSFAREVVGGGNIDLSGLYAESEYED